MRHSNNLMTQVLLVNLLLIVAAVVAASVAANPDINISSKPEAAMVMGFAVALTVLVNVVLLQRRFRPLERLVDEMERADLSRPGANLRERGEFGGPEEVERLHHAFRRMLERLETERRRASSAALTAQEEERARIARDLHDEVNQSLTGLLLRLEALRSHAPAELAHELSDTKVLANQAMEELLALARQLRPTALDDLGLKAALAGNVDELSRSSGIRATFEAEGDFSDLPGRLAAGALPRGAGGALERRAARRRRERAGQAGPSRRPGGAHDLRRRPRVHVRPDQPWAGPRAACASAHCSWAATCESSPGLKSAQGFGSACR